MADKKALALLKKYYLPYRAEGSPSAEDIDRAVQAGVFAPASEITHDALIAGIKALAGRLSLTAAAKGFLHSLSSGDLRYRTVLSSLVWAGSLPAHAAVKDRSGFGYCEICGCSHGLDNPQRTDWNEYGVFRFMPPKQYGREPNYTCAEYVFHDLREFEKLPSVEPCEEDYRLLNGIFAAAGQMKSHNMDTALVSEIRRRKLLGETGNAVHCLLGVLSICGILEGSEHKGFLHNFTNARETQINRDGLSFYPLYYWRGKNGINYAAVETLFGSFSGDRLSPDKAVLSPSSGEISPVRAPASKAAQHFSKGDFCVTLTNKERPYLALDALDPSWETVSLFSVTHHLHKRTVLFYREDTIVKVIYEEQSVDVDGAVLWKHYREYDTKLATDDRKLLLPLTERGRAKPITPTNVMAAIPFGCQLDLWLEKSGSRMYVGNRRNCQQLAVGEKDRVNRIRSDSDFHEFMQYYITTCPGDYFVRIAEIRSMKHQTVRFRAGDIFRCQQDRTHYTYGLILGKTRELEKWKELPAKHSLRDLMAQPILLRMYDFVTAEADLTPEQLSKMPLRPPMICSDEEIIWGTHRIIGHKSLEPDEILFPLRLARQTAKSHPTAPLRAENLTRLLPETARKAGGAPGALYVEWGFASVEIPWETVPEPLRQMLNGGNYAGIGMLLGISGEYCGRTLADILKNAPKHMLQYDLLLPENTEKFRLVMRSLGLPEDCSFDEFAERYGGISRQRYIELLNERCR